MADIDPNSEAYLWALAAMNLRSHGEHAAADRARDHYRALTGDRPAVTGYLPRSMGNPPAIHSGLRRSA